MKNISDMSILITGGGSGIGEGEHNGTGNGVGEYIYSELLQVAVIDDAFKLYSGEQVA